MAALEIQGNGDTGTAVTDENINKTIESLDDAQQKDFIHKCLQVDPLSRPSARELLFHPLLFEVHSLKLLSAHALVNSTSKSTTEIRSSIRKTICFKPLSTFSKYIRDNNGRGASEALRTRYGRRWNPLCGTPSAANSFKRYSSGWGIGKIRRRRQVSFLHCLRFDYIYCL